MKKFGRILMIILVAAVFIGTFVYLFQRSRPKEIQYQELTPEMGTIAKSTVVTGKIQPRDEVNVKAQISGIVAELYKQAGDLVKENEVIAKLKVIPEMSQLSSAQSRVRLSEVNLKQAQTNYDREKKLFDQQLVSAEAFEQVAQALKQAEEEYAASQESLEIVRDGVSSSNKSGSSTLVRSSVSGLILDIPVKVGNTVINSNTFNDGTTIATVADMDDLIFDGNIDETEVGRLHLGLPVIISVTIRSGYSANAEIELQRAENVLMIPESALQFDGDDTFVYVLKEDGTYENRPVETGLSDGVNIEIKSGLSLGEKVRGPQLI